VLLALSWRQYSTAFACCQSFWYIPVDVMKWWTWWLEQSWLALCRAVIVCCWSFVVSLWILMNQWWHCQARDHMSAQRWQISFTHHLYGSLIAFRQSSERCSKVTTISFLIVIRGLNSLPWYACVCARAFDLVLCIFHYSDQLQTFTHAFSLTDALMHLFPIHSADDKTSASTRQHWGDQLVIAV